jgi:UDP-glucose 4-epimerase
MNVFVTGGAGYIGSICAEALLDAGHQVTVYDNLSEGHRSAVDPRARFVLGRPEEDNNILQAVKEARPDAIMHFAANAQVGESMANPGKYFHNTVSNGLKLLEAAVACGVKKFVFSSTCATYGPPERVPMTEDLPQRPINPYGESKLMFEKMLQWYERIHKLEFIAFRYFNAAGASKAFGKHHRIETHLIPNVLQVALGQKPHCEIYGTDYPTPDGTCVRDYIHVLDIADSHLRALESIEKVSGEAFNVGNSRGFSILEVLDAAEKITGCKVPRKMSPRRPGDPAILVASKEKLRQSLGWEAQHSSLEEIITSAWTWKQKHPHGYAEAASH